MTKWILSIHNYVMTCLVSVVLSRLFLSISHVSLQVGYLAKKRRTTLQARGQEQSKSATGKSKKMLKTVTKRIVILSVAFCLCNAPLSIYNIIVLTPSLMKQLDSTQKMILLELRLPFHILLYLNNGINFLLYCFIGSGFRKDLVGIFRPSSRTSTTR